MKSKKLIKPFTLFKLSLQIPSSWLIPLLIRELHCWGILSPKRLPYEKKTWNLLRSPHVHSKSREAYEKRVYRLDFFLPAAPLSQSLTRIFWLKKSFGAQLRLKVQVYAPAHSLSSPSKLGKKPVLFFHDISRSRHPYTRRNDSFS